VLHIKVSLGDQIEVLAGDVGRVRLAPLVAPSGERVKILNPPGFAPFEIGEIEAAYSAGTGWWDSEMRRWEGAPHGWGSVSRFSWSG
jgi:hypothetical protein